MKMKPLIKNARSCNIKIYIAGDYDQAVKTANEYCNEVGYCVTITPTKYVHTNGPDDGLPGVIVGLINYPRFPSEYPTLLNHAVKIAERLRVDLNQESFSIETPENTIWYSYRPEDMVEE
jgi:hypothetical protein